MQLSGRTPVRATHDEPELRPLLLAGALSPTGMTDAVTYPFDDSAIAEVCLADAETVEAALSSAAAAERELARLGATDGRRPAGPQGDLTPREREVLGLVAQGLSDAQIAERLALSPHTVHRHVANVRTKLRLPSRAAAVAYATRAGLL